MTEWFGISDVGWQSLRWLACNVVCPGFIGYGFFRIVLALWQGDES